QKVTKVENPKLELNQPYLINYNCMVFSIDENGKELTVRKFPEPQKNNERRCELEFHDNECHIKLVRDGGIEYFHYIDDK
ncbi:5922_t:CDS:2, partial [Dentiscutata heterogama]